MQATAAAALEREPADEPREGSVLDAERIAHPCDGQGDLGVERAGEPGDGERLAARAEGAMPAHHRPRRERLVGTPAVPRRME